MEKRKRREERQGGKEMDGGEEGKGEREGKEATKVPKEREERGGRGRTIRWERNLRRKSRKRMKGSKKVI